MIAWGVGRDSCVVARGKSTLSFVDVFACMPEGYGRGGNFSSRISRPSTSETLPPLAYGPSPARTVVPSTAGLVLIRRMFLPELHSAYGVEVAPEGLGARPPRGRTLTHERASGGAPNADRAEKAFVHGGGVPRVGRGSTRRRAPDDDKDGDGDGDGDSDHQKNDGNGNNEGRGQGWPRGLPHSQLTLPRERGGGGGGQSCSQTGSRVAGSRVAGRFSYRPSGHLVVAHRHGGYKIWEHWCCETRRAPEPGCSRCASTMTTGCFFLSVPLSGLAGSSVQAGKASSPSPAAVQRLQGNVCQRSPRESEHETVRGLQSVKNKFSSLRFTFILASGRPLKNLCSWLSAQGPQPVTILRGYHVCSWSKSTVSVYQSPRYGYISSTYATPAPRIWWERCANLTFYTLCPIPSRAARTCYTYRSTAPAWLCYSSSPPPSLGN